MSSFAWKILVIGGSIPAIALLGAVYHLSQEAILSYMVVGGVVFGAMLLWFHANANAKGDEWWQDDSASGWRGY